jgi:hypothetical protein
MGVVSHPQFFFPLILALGGGRTHPQAKCHPLFGPWGWFGHPKLATPLAKWEWPVGLCKNPRTHTASPKPFFFFFFFLWVWVLIW